MFDKQDRDRLILIETLLKGGRGITKNACAKLQYRQAIWSGGGSVLELLIGWFGKGHIG
jgi:hypothetical protein